jgi:hypothetical protein
MKQGSIFAGITIILLLFLTTCARQSSFPILKGPYLGQKPPGDVPELFAPGIVTSIYAEHTAAVFTHDGKEVFWTRIMNQGQSPRLIVTMHMNEENGVWNRPELAPFNGGSATFMASISPDEKRLYFNSLRPTEKGGEPKRSDWIVDRTEDGWGEPRLNNVDANWESRYYFIQETISGNLYFADRLENVDREIGLFRSTFVDGKYQKPEALDPTINSEHLDYGFHVDPSEKYIIFSSERPEGFTETDLYISYHQHDNSWGPAINLGSKINSIGTGGSAWPYLSPDGKYLFFLSSVHPYIDYDEKEHSYADLEEISLSYTNGYSKIYWVNTNFVEDLKPDHLE